MLFVVALMAFLFPLAYSPGPGNMFFAALGARFGTVATLPANAGYHITTLVVTGLLGLGLVSAVHPGTAFFVGLKLAGSVYVMWLAWKMATSGSTDTGMQSGKAGFLDGVWLLLLNPKAYVIILLMYSQFGAMGPADLLARVGVISLVFTLNNLLAFLLWTVAGDGLGRLFRSEAHARRLNLVFAAILAGVGFWMMLA
jgi:threonine/homoserine/homoserine lactone efflux protein